MNWDDVKRQLLQDNELKQAYEKSDLAYDIAQMVIDARLERGMTQAMLAERLGTKQPSVARLEAGNTVPSLSFLQRVADALETELLAPRFSMFDRTVVIRVDSGGALAGRQLVGTRPMTSGGTTE